MAAIPLVIITLDLVVTPLVVSTIMKGKPFQFQFQPCHYNIYFSNHAMTLVRTPEPLTSSRNISFQMHEVQDSTKGTQSSIHTINTSTNRNITPTIDF